MKLVIGLGNVGKEFQDTVHNTGFLTLQKIMQKFGVSGGKKMCNSLVSEANISGTKVIFARPTTYMNNSGVAVISLQKKFGVDAKDMVIIQDDIDLPSGIVRIRNSGSAGTHNGMKSVLEFSNGDDFVRIRVGVGKQKENQDLADYVLSKIKNKDTYTGIEIAANAIEDWILGATFTQIQQKYSK